MYQGELEIIVLPEETRTTIIVEAIGNVYDTRCNWYQVNPELAYWEESNTNNMVLKFVDANQGCPPSQYDPPIFGYGLYRIWVGNDYIFVDFRDADYGTLTGYIGFQDMHLWHDVGTDYFYSDYTSYIGLGDTYAIWDMEPKDLDTYPIKIPVTVRNYWAGGYSGNVSVDGVWKTSPHQTLWTMGTHHIEAHATQGANWSFHHWSDGGDRSHYVDVSLDEFGKMYTAHYVVVPLMPPPGGNELDAFPNPFNPTTTVRYNLREHSHVTLTVLNLLGQQVALLEDSEKETGIHEVTLDGTRLASGLYYCRLRAGREISTRKLMLAK
jgi:hypothetical protein